MVARQIEEVLMVADSIEREILIEAPVDVVWRVVTEPEHLTRWFSDAVEIDPRPGGEGTLTFGLPEITQPVAVAIQIESIEPQHKFSFRWVHDSADRRLANSMLVDFMLTAEGEKTRLRVVESGLHAMQWSEEAKAQYFDEHSEGWDGHLSRLREHATSQFQASAQR
jgi:uncharacterized protein YndB with AHSA1/START domain